jgi:hypothetical protein
MEGVDRGPRSSVGIGSEEDKEVDRSYSSTNNRWGWELEMSMVGEKGLMKEGSKLDC